MKYLSILLVLIFVAGCSVNNNYGITAENDIIGHTDNNYTHGTFFTHSVSVDHASCFLKTSAELLPSFKYFDTDPQDLTRIKTELGQEIHTPEDLSKQELIIDDNPYAGYLYGKLGRVNANTKVKLETAIELGIVGPSSLAEDAQWFVHHDLDKGTDPMGWDHQLRDEPIINISHTRTRLWQFNHIIHPITEVKTRLGNAHTDFRFTNGVRVGYNILDLDGSNSNYLSAYLFGLSNLQFVGRNIFYDGNTWKDSHSVDTKHIVGSVDYGVFLGYKGYNLKFQVTTTSKQYEEQAQEVHTYGGLIFGVDW